MNLVHRVRRTSAVLAAAAFVALASQASAQEISESHLKAARAAIAAIHATDQYDSILPQAAQALKQELIRQNPDLEALVISTVDEKTIGMAGRRADLEREAALVYARNFSEPDLTAIAAFYDSEAGKKLLANGPLVAREVVKAAEIWQNGIARDLAEAVGTELEKIVGAQAQANPPAAAPAPEPEGGTTEPAPAQ